MLFSNCTIGEMQNRQAKSGVSNSLNKQDALNIAEDDVLRSQYVLNLINERNYCVTASNDSKIPRVLIQFWDDVARIPSDVKKCIDSWKPLEKHGFKRLLFDDVRAIQFIKNNFTNRYLDAFKRCRHPAMRSDYFRLCFTLINGGFYVDADDVYKGGNPEALLCDNRLKLRPLCYNLLTNSMVKVPKIIRTQYDSRKFIFYVNNNPIITPPGHPVLRSALERSTQILITQTSNGKQDVQSTTGPGNLTASLVRYAVERGRDNRCRDFVLLVDWDEISVSQWPLGYRKKKRNWRLWDGYNM